MDDARFPGESEPAPAPRRWPRRLGIVALGVLTLLGPWPVDNGSYVGTAYERTTLARLGRMPGPTPPGPIRVGVAEVDLTPARPGPLAGFSNQAGKAYGAVDSPCSARALTVASGRRAVTILTADLLLINAELARAVLDRAGLEAEDVYFTASHTHGGPGGWGRHPLERIVAGKFDPGVLAMLAERLGDVVRRSRVDPVPAEVAMVQAHPRGRQKNRVVPDAPTHDALSALVFRPPGATADAPPLAILAVFGAHATIVRADPPRLSADYPGALAATLKAKTGAGMVLFASGAVGDASPVRPPNPSPSKAARVLGGMLADDLLAALPSARFSSEVPLDRLRLAVDLPPVRLSFFSAWLRFSPAATWWIADRTTHLDALRLGPAVLVGFPGDEAGHLAEKVVRDRSGQEPTPIVTSFNGDYRGYFESSQIFRERSCYETRWMNFYGPELGEYLGSLAGEMIRHLTGSKTTSRMGLPDSQEPIVAAILLAMMIVLAMVIQQLLDPHVRRRIAWAAAAVAMTYLIARTRGPNLVDWAWFEVPSPALYAALTLVAVAVIGTCSGGGSRRAWDFLAWAAMGVLLGAWPIVLAGGLALLDRSPIDPVADVTGYQSK